MILDNEDAYLDLIEREDAEYLAQIEREDAELYQVSLITTDRPTLLFRWR
jgi:hypothetical protein